jgi:hypothetical protein
MDGLRREISDLRPFSGIDDHRRQQDMPQLVNCQTVEVTLGKIHFQPSMKMQQSAFDLAFAQPRDLRTYFFEAIPGHTTFPAKIGLFQILTGYFIGYAGGSVNMICLKKYQIGE